MNRRQLATGTVIFSTGDPAESFFVLMAGAVTFAPAGSRDSATAVDPVFGLADALLNRPRTYSATVSADCTLLEVTWSLDNLTDIAGKHPKILGALGRHFGKLAEQRLCALHAASDRERQLWGGLLAVLSGSPEALAAGLAPFVGELSQQMMQQFPVDDGAMLVASDPAAPGTLEMLPGMMLPQLATAWRLGPGAVELRLGAITLAAIEGEGRWLVPLTALASPPDPPLSFLSVHAVLPARLEGVAPSSLLARYAMDSELTRQTMMFAVDLLRGLEKAENDFQRRRSELRDWFGVRAELLAPVRALPGVSACLGQLAITPSAAAASAAGTQPAAGVEADAGAWPVLQQLPLSPAERSELELHLTQLRCGAEGNDLTTAKYRLVTRYWDCAALAAQQRVRGPWPDEVRRLLRFGVLDERLLEPAQLARLTELAMGEVDGVYYMDEWLEAIVTGTVAPTAGDELAMKKLGAADKIDKAKQKLDGERDILLARVYDWKQCAAEVPQLMEKINKGIDTTRKLIDLYLQEKDHLKSPDGVLLKWEENDEVAGASLQRLRERSGKMRINEGRIVEAIRGYGKGLEELNAARALARGEDRESPEKVIAGEVTTILRQMAKMSVGPRGNHLSVLTKDSVLADGSDLTSRQTVLEIITRAAEFDPGLFQRTFKGIDRVIVPYILVLPCMGENGICWEPFERKNRATGRGRLVVPLFPRKPLPDLVLQALADFRWQMAREVAAHYWMEEGLTGRYYQYFTEAKLKGDLREHFVRNYILWQTYEAQGIQKLDRLVRQLFWIHLPFPAKVKEQLKNRGAIYALLYQQDKNREKSSYL